MTWTAAVLVPVFLIGLGVLAVIFIALRIAVKQGRKLDAEREAALAPVRLLRKQHEAIAYVISDPLYETLPESVQARLMKAHDNYTEIERKRK